MAAAGQKIHLIVDRKEHVVCLGPRVFFQEFKIAKRIRRERRAAVTVAHQAAVTCQAGVRRWIAHIDVGAGIAERVQRLPC